MTTARTRKTTGTSRAKKTPEPKAPEPMDDSVEEVATPVDANGVADTSLHAPMSERNSYSLAVLIEEVVHLFPETDWHVVQINGWGVGIGVQFSNGESPDMFSFLSLLSSEKRIAEVSENSGDYGYVLVILRNDPVLYDSREGFGLNDAYRVLHAEDGS